MKRLVMAAVALLTGAAAFANVELDLNLVRTTKEELPWIGESVQGTGVSENAVFYFGSGNSPFEAGLSIFSSFLKVEDVSVSQVVPLTWRSFMSESNIDLDEKYYNTLSYYKVYPSGGFIMRSFDFDGGWNYTLGLGPSFRYTFTNNFSLSVRPGIYMNLIGGSVTETNFVKNEFVWRGTTVGEALSLLNAYNGGLKYYMSDYYLETSDDTYLAVNAGFDLDIGGRAWLVNNNGFHFGLDFGIDISAMTNSGVSCGSISGSYKPDNRIKTQLYLGVCFNFGDRRFDK